MEFFAGELREPDERLLATMETLGSQIGQFVAGRRAAEEVRARESRLRAMLEAALDAVVTMDAEGCVIGWNHAAEAIFGYSASEADGREMAELIVPPHLREAHRRGLARYLETDRGVVLDRRLELTGMRRDGSEFPVELTITRIALPGPPTFTGYLRDITERVRPTVSCARRARAWSRWPTRSASASSATSTTARSSASPPSCCASGACARRPTSPSSCSTSRSTSSPPGSTRSARWPAACTRRCSASGAWPPAIEALALRVPLAVELEALPEARLSEPVEAAAYYVVAEALANVQKHARPRRVVVSVTADEHGLDVRVADDGIGGADADGHGLRGLADRVEALGGRLTVDSPRRGGTVLRAAIPRDQVSRTEASRASEGVAGRQGPLEHPA